MRFAYQHDAHFRSRSSDSAIEIISFFDHAARSDKQRNGGVDVINDFTRARVVLLNHTDNTASEMVTLKSLDKLLNPS